MVKCFSVALCLRVDGGHVAQAAVEAAHLEENALLRARGELAPCVTLQLLGQAEAWRENEKNSLKHIWRVISDALGSPASGTTSSPAEPVLAVDMWKPLC